MRSNISWLKRPGYNPMGWGWLTGCSKITAGCANCYAEALSLRMGWSIHPWTRQHESENIMIHDDRFDQPKSWRKPCMVFVNPMTDLFLDRVPYVALDRMFDVIDACPQHTFIILVKRIKQAAAYFAQRDHHSANVWLGVTVEQPSEVWRIDALLSTWAPVKFLSIEPLLAPLAPLPLKGIDWVNVGAESGQHPRRMNLRWAEAIRDQCLAFEIAFFFKQQNGLRPGQSPWLPDRDGFRWQWHQWPGERHDPVCLDDINRPATFPGQLSQLPLWSPARSDGLLNESDVPPDDLTDYLNRCR